MRKVCLIVLAAAVRGSFAEEIRYEYSIRSELTRVSCGGETLFGYGYDLAGNLRWSCIGSSTNVYETNARNQYTRLTDSQGRVYHFAYDVRLIDPPGLYPRERLLTTTTFVYDGMVSVLETIADIGSCANCLHGTARGHSLFWYNMLWLRACV